jgi:hypothetical protein
MLSAAFTAGGVCMGLDGEQSGLLVAGFFGLCTLVMIGTLLPGSSSLRLSPEGFRVRILYRTTSVRWDEVAGFGVVSIGFQTLVVWDYSPGSPHFVLRGRVSATLRGHDAALPDTFGRSPRDLAELLKAYRDHFAGGSTAGPDPGPPADFV